MIENPRISIIIPIYNCEKYLEECLISAINQTVNPKEIICINDGSDDGSNIILENFSAQYSNIIVINQKNQGAGAARNAGLRIAKGEFVAFLDGDDYYIDKSALEEMFNLCKSKGIKTCRALKNNSDGSIYEREELFIHLLNEQGNATILDYMDYQFDYDYTCYLIDRSLIEDNGIYFPEYKRFQDPPFLVKVLFCSKKIILCNKWLYSYRQPLVAARFDANKVYDLLCGLKDNLVFSKQNSMNILFHNTIERIDYEYYYIINNFASEDIRIPRVLFEINDIVYGSSNQDFIRPIKALVDLYEKSSKRYIDDTIEEISKSHGIYIYGAGYYGNVFLNFLIEHNLKKKVIAFIVSNNQANDEKDGIPIKNIDSVNDTSCPVYIAVSGIAQRDITFLLIKKDFKTIVPLDTYLFDREEKKRLENI